MFSDNKSPIMAMVLSKALANSEHLDDKQTSRAMIAAMMLGNPLLSILLVRSMKDDKGAVPSGGKGGSKDGASPAQVANA